MMVLLRLSILAGAAALVSACAVPPVSESASEKALALSAAPNSKEDSAKEAPPQKDTAPGDREAAVRKAALSYAAVSDPVSKSYKIGPLDVLEVTVFKVPDLSKKIQVSEAGTINYPLIGEMDAGGKTAREMEQTLTSKLGAKYLQKPQISVFVKEHNSQRITIEGAVKKPGVIPIAGGMSLLQAIAHAQGLERTAESSAVVLRQANGKRTAAKYDVASIREGQADDPQLQAGDVIIVPTSDVKEGINAVLKVLPLAQVVPLL
ncbi:MAG: polysaccharide export protein [Rhodomicrobium sp.]|nr:polysaccharide export protein [Rhodomicrobium sp.]